MDIEQKREFLKILVDLDYDFEIEVDQILS